MFSPVGWLDLLATNYHTLLRLLPWLVACLTVIPHLPKLCLYRIVDGSAFPSYCLKSPVQRGPLGPWIRGCRTGDMARGCGRSNVAWMGRSRFNTRKSFRRGPVGRQRTFYPPS